MRPSEKLAQSLEVLQNLQKQGKYAIQSKDISRTHRERLLENAFLEEDLYLYINQNICHLDGTLSAS